jgi:predicted nucleotidyltransferase
VDTEHLLRSLNEAGVRYVLIGAVAFPVHGYARSTQDVDVFVEASEENARRVLEALRRFGYDVSDLTVSDLQTFKILIRGYAVNPDIHPYVEGATFEEVWSRRVLQAVGSTTAPFASLDDLIRMKEAAGRPKDLEDLKYLRRLKDRRPPTG